MPAGMVRLLRTFSSERALRWEMQSITLCVAQDYYPLQEESGYSSKDDAPWIKRLAADNGRAIISGDTKMLRKPHEKLALVEANLVVILFPPAWSKWKFCRKCALIMHWWPAIAEAIRSATPGLYQVPSNHPDDDRLKLRPIPTVDLKMTKIQSQLDAGPRKRAERKAKQAIQQEGLIERS